MVSGIWNMHPDGTIYDEDYSARLDVQRYVNPYNGRLWLYHVPVGKWYYAEEVLRRATDDPNEPVSAWVRSAECDGYKPPLTLWRIDTPTPAEMYGREP